VDLPIVQVVVGLAAVYFVLSIVASAINETIAGIWKLRARDLERGIVNLVTGAAGDADGQGRALVTAVYEHSLVNGYGKGTSKPSYLASRSFRNALLDVTGLLDATATAADGTAPSATNVEALLDGVPSERLRATLQTIWRSADRDAQEFRAAVERWFDRGMERVTGWYKRRAQLIMFGVALVFVVVVNVDTIRIADQLWTDDAVREALVASVEASPDGPAPDAALDRLDELGLPIGWEAGQRPDGAGDWITSAFGWLITAVAVSFGAPFWFDVLGKVSNLRAAGRKPPSTVSTS
jgi:hypothetical protein